MLQRVALPITLLATQMIGYGLLVTVGPVLQDRYTPPRYVREARVASKMGQKAPKELLSILTSLPATVIVYPDCMECTSEHPRDLLGQPFRRPVDVVMPGANEGDLAKVGKLGSAVRLLTSSSQLAVDLGIDAAPRVFGIDETGKIDFIQPTHVPAARLHEVVNGR